MNENMEKKESTKARSVFRALFQPGKPQAVYIGVILLIYYLVPFAANAYAVSRGLDEFEHFLAAYLLIIPALIFVAGTIYGILTKDFYRHISWTVLCGFLLPFTAQLSVPVTLGYCGVMGVLAFLPALLGRFVRKIVEKL